MDVCSKHWFDSAVAPCRECGEPCCGRCLVYPQGPKRPALCLDCALAIAGARSKAKQRAISKRREHERVMRMQARVEEDRLEHNAMAGRVRLLMLMNGLALGALTLSVLAR